MRLSSAGKVGIAFILIGVSAYAVFAYLMATRSFVPVKMPISLSRTHFTTGEFRINAEGDYEIYIYTLNKPSTGCDLRDVLKGKWSLSKGGKVVSEGTYNGEGWWFGGFQGQMGVYRLNVELLSDASCLNSVEPWLEVSSYRTYEKYWGVRRLVTSLALALITVGSVLIVRSVVVARVGGREPLDTIISDRRVYPCPDLRSTFPLNRRFSGLPAYGLVGSLVMVSVFLPYWVLHSWVYDPNSHGIYVRITKPKTTSFVSEAWEKPVIVRVRPRKKYAANGYRPEVPVNSNPIAWEDLSRTLQAELSRRVDRVIYVDGDDNLPYSDIVQVVDIARYAWPGVPVVLLTPELKKTIDP